MNNKYTENYMYLEELKNQVVDILEEIEAMPIDSWYYIPEDGEHLNEPLPIIMLQGTEKIAYDEMNKSLETGDRKYITMACAIYTSICEVSKKIYDEKINYANKLKQELTGLK